MLGDNLTRGIGRGNGSKAGSEEPVEVRAARSGVEAEAGAARAALMEGWSFLSKDTFPM